MCDPKAQNGDHSRRNSASTENGIGFAKMILVGCNRPGTYPINWPSSAAAPRNGIYDYRRTAKKSAPRCIQSIRARVGRMAEHARIIGANRDRLPAGGSWCAAGTIRPLHSQGIPLGRPHGRNPRGRRPRATDFSPNLPHNPSVFGSIRLRDLALSASYKRMFAIPSAREASAARTAGVRTRRPICRTRATTSVSGIAGPGVAAARSRVASHFPASGSRRIGLPRVSRDPGDIRGNCGLTSQSRAVKVEGVSP